MYTLFFALRTRSVSHVAAIAMQWRRRLLGLVDYQVERNYISQDFFHLSMVAQIQICSADRWQLTDRDSSND